SCLLPHCPHIVFSPTAAPLHHARLQHAGIPAMPTSFASAGRAVSDKVLFCLGLVVAFVFTAFGLAKLVELLRTRRRTEAKGLLGEAPPGRYLLSYTPNGTPLLLNTAHASGFLAPSFLNPTTATPSFTISFPTAKPRPQNPLTGVIQYTKAAPSLYHITSPRVYAVRHRRRPHFMRPGPSLLRHVITITAQGRRLQSTVRGVQASTARALAVSFIRFPHGPPGVHTSTALLAGVPPVSSLSQTLPVSTSTPTVPQIPLYPLDVQHVHQTADALVGAHPDALPLASRVPTQAQRAQDYFSWVAFSGVGAGFRFGLVRGSNSGAIRPQVAAIGVLKTTGVAPRPLILGSKNGKTKLRPLILASKNANANVDANGDASGKRMFGYADWARAKRAARAGMLEAGWKDKENVSVGVSVGVVAAV
ncbi:hypothetical protein C8R46DRAFT_485190, partial [Mycena filopes]